MTDSQIRYFYYVQLHCKKKVDLTQKNKATYHNQLFKLTQLATDNLKTLVHLMNKSQSTKC